MGHCPAGWHQEKGCADNDLGAGVCRRFILPSKNRTAASKTKYSHIRSQEAIYVATETENRSPPGLERPHSWSFVLDFPADRNPLFGLGDRRNGPPQFAPIIVFGILDSASRAYHRRGGKHHWKNRIRARETLRFRQVHRPGPRSRSWEDPEAGAISTPPHERILVD